jgi:hypothetical protein
MTPKDNALIEFLTKATQEGTVRWEPTADRDKLTVALRGQYTAMLIYQPNGFNKLLLRNADGDVILRVGGEQDIRLEPLFDLATRNAYNTDHAIDVIIGNAQEETEEKKIQGNPSSPTTEEDIPF